MRDEIRNHLADRGDSASRFDTASNLIEERGAGFIGSGFVSFVHGEIDLVSSQRLHSLGMR